MATKDAHVEHCGADSDSSGAEAGVILRQAVLSSVLRDAGINRGSRGLNLCCGHAASPLKLAETVGAHGSVFAMDQSAEVLDGARDLASRWGVGSRLSWRKGGILELPYSDNAFDWVFSLDGGPFTPANGGDAARELARTLRPGGRLILLGVTAKALLPGHAPLEARLSQAAAEQGELGKLLHHGGAWTWAAGLQPPVLSSCLDELRGPLEEHQSRALARRFERAIDALERSHGLAPEDKTRLRELCNPDAADCIFRRPDYYGVITYTVLQARKGG